jgi:hypothetical protein
MSPAAVLLARSAEGMKSGPIGLAVILILCIVCYFLFKSMSKHLKTVREEFPGQDTTAAGGAPSTTGPQAHVGAEPPVGEVPAEARPGADQPAEPPAAEA